MSFDARSKRPLLLSSCPLTDNLPPPSPEYSFDDVFPPWDPPDWSPVECKSVTPPEIEIYSQSPMHLVPQSQKEIDFTLWRPSVDQQPEQRNSSPPTPSHRSPRRFTRPSPKQDTEPLFATSRAAKTDGDQGVRHCSFERLGKRTLKFNSKGEVRKTRGCCQSDAQKGTWDW
jgi:hypothetical protein